MSIEPFLLFDCDLFLIKIGTKKTTKKQTKQTNKQKEERVNFSFGKGKTTKKQKIPK